MAPWCDKTLYKVKNVILTKITYFYCVYLGILYCAATLTPGSVHLSQTPYNGTCERHRPLNFAGFGQCFISCRDEPAGTGKLEVSRTSPIMSIPFPVESGLELDYLIAFYPQHPLTNCNPRPLAQLSFTIKWLFH